MHVHRNRRYEEEIVMLMWHKKGEQRMIENSQTENTDTGISQDMCMERNKADKCMSREYNRESHRSYVLINYQKSKETWECKRC
jgi:hypothetical protein